MCLEGTELLTPERVDLIEPRLQGDEGLRAQPVHAHPGISVERVRLDQPVGPEDPQVPAQSGAAHTGGGSQLAGPSGAPGQQMDHPSAGGIGQGRESVVQVVHVWVNV